MSNYSGYVEHSDFYIVPQSYQDAFDTFEEGCVRMLFVQAIIGVILIIFGAGVMFGGE
jgi:hypothetical protein|nr:MAG TPA: hypothetical protein [Caudoviricetes sp.]